jgi:hypothetical protein
MWPYQRGAGINRKDIDMGLDMYLNARSSVNAYDSEDSEQKALQQVPFIAATGMRVTGITYRAMYWRKANAIHKWFVDNVQDGVDNCEEFHVSPQHLQLLRDTCQQVLDDNALAGELLPPSEGFFFGTTDITNYYFDDLRATVEALDAALEFSLRDRWATFTYQSSW